MSDRYEGGILSGTAPTVTQQGANGVYTLSQELQYQGQGVWPAAAQTPILKSLRFRSSATAYLSRTPASATNRKTWTWSGWVKRSNIGSSGTLFGGGTSGSNYGQIYFSNNALNFYNATGNEQLVTTALYRDPSAWYHIVVAIDTTQATASNRIKFYVNGVQQTSFATANYPSQNADLYINSSNIHSIGSLYYTAGNTDYFDGYLGEVNFVDGVQLTPSSFGTTDANGIWQSIPYAGTYGTNGFYLKFTDTTSTSTLGTDSSGNGNTWTVNNISLTAGTTYDSMLDSPSNASSTIANYCTFNPVVYNAGSVAYSNGNLLLTMSGNADRFNIGTLCTPTGKFYWELTVSAINQSAGLGIGISKQTQVANGPWVSAGGPNTLFFNTNSGWNVYGTNLGTGALGTFASNDVIGVAMDMVNNIVYIYQNNTLLTSLSGYIDLNTPHTLFVDSYYNGSSVALNCGQQPFVYTPPTGFNRLNTYNLPVPTIPAGNKVMDATLYSGNSSTQTVTNAGGFKPDFVWIKDRNTARGSMLFNSIAGVYNYMRSNTTAAEQNETDTLTAFNSNGFNVSTNIAVNNTGETYVGWQWQAGQGVTSSNTNGTITSTVSVNTTSGFSIATYNGSNSAGSFGHGLGVAPKMIIIKQRNQAGSNWVVGIDVAGWNWASDWLILDSTGAKRTDGGTTIFTSAPTSTVVNIGGGSLTSTSGATLVAYCWSPVAGFSSFGSYAGNSSSDGPFIYTGFRPKYILIKNISNGTTDWYIFDTARNTYNVANTVLNANLTSAELTGGDIDIISNGFKPRASATATNKTGDTYIYACFAENPFKIARAR